MKMKIVWLHAHFLNWMGGHNFIFEVTRRLSKNYSLTILSSASNLEAKKRFERIKIPLIDLSGKSTNNLLYWLFLNYFLKKEEQLASTFIAKADLVISSHFPANVIASRFGKPHIYCCWEPYAPFFDENYIAGFPGLQRIFFKLLAKIYKDLDIEATKKATKIITLSQFNKNWIKQVYGRDDAIVSYEGVDTNFFQPNSGNLLRKKYAGDKIILHSTDFTAIKGTNYLIRALPQVLEIFPNLKVLITHTLKNLKGKMEVERLAKELGIQNKIEFLGRVDYKLLPDYYNLADMVVQPSVNQSMSLSVKEAMACGTPVITSLEGGEQTRNGEAGFLVNPKNTKALSTAIINLFKNPALAKKMGEAGRKIIKEKFSWDVVTRVFQDTIQSVTKEYQLAPPT